MMFAIVVKLDYEVHMLNVQTAFLSADVEEDVFIKKAPGNETNDKARAPPIMKLKKSLYGLRQRPKNWFGKMNAKLVVIGSHPLKSDLCVYV